MSNRELHQLRVAAREELVDLWHDLAAAYRASRSTPKEADQTCQRLIRRIKALTAVTGATPPGMIELGFLLCGLYQQVHRQLGIAVWVGEGLLQHARDFARPGGRLALGYPEGLLEEHRDRRLYFARANGRVIYRIADRTGCLPGMFHEVAAARTALEDLAP